MQFFVSGNDNDKCENFGMFEPRLILTDVNNPNIRYLVLKVDDNHAHKKL